MNSSLLPWNFMLCRKISNCTHLLYLWLSQIWKEYFKYQLCHTKDLKMVSTAAHMEADAVGLVWKVVLALNKNSYNIVYLSSGQNKQSLLISSKKWNKCKSRLFHNLTAYISRLESQAQHWWVRSTKKSTRHLFFNFRIFLHSLNSYDVGLQFTSLPYHPIQCLGNLQMQSQLQNGIWSISCASQPRYLQCIRYRQTNHTTGDIFLRSNSKYGSKQDNTVANELKPQRQPSVEVIVRLSIFITGTG